MLGAIVGDIVGSVYEWDNIRVRYKKSLMAEILKVKTENKFISWQAN